MPYGNILNILAAEGDTADREPSAAAVAARRRNNAACEKAQAVSIGFTVARGRPVETFGACVAQVVAWIDVAAPDKHQRRLHNSIRIS